MNINNKTTCVEGKLVVSLKYDRTITHGLHGLHERLQGQSV